MKNENIYDVCVVGGGPAGMMAAIAAAKEGAKVILLEKNKKLGQKLLLTGGGRCNITNAEFDNKKLVSFYGKKGKFLFPAFSVFGPQEVIDFFEEEKVKTKIERGGRVFPKTNKAEHVLKAFVLALRRLEVDVALNAKVHRFSLSGDKIKKIVLKNKREVFARNYILATGGMAYPLTGSTGDGIRFLPALNHQIERVKPVLTPLIIKEHIFYSLQGLSLKNIELTVMQEKKKLKAFGECMFTHYGLSGPVPLELSKEIGEMLELGEVKLFLDVKPALDIKKLDERIRRDFQKYSNKRFKNSLEDLLPKKMIPVIIALSKINPDKKVNEITKEERMRLARLLKKIEMSVAGLAGFELAITSSGGVPLNEIDDKTMKSKKIENLFFAGEIIDVDGPTGGFNLQLCWSSGFVAGKSAAKK